MKAKNIAGIAMLTFTVSACDNIQMAPKIIEADGQTYFACKGVVWTNTESGNFVGGTTAFKVSFTDTAGLDHVVRGLSKLAVSDPPKDATAPFPSDPPNPQFTTDIDGKPFTNGNVYTWSNGTQAQLDGGKWRPVRLRAACS